MTKNTELKSTINLPRTSFSMKANLPQREPKLLDWWDRIDVYRKVLDARAGAQTYVLHDGPPYANDPLHLGHALNKILKDFVVKSRSMLGYRASYVPGWDCHGLPIELRVDRKLGSKKAKMSALEIRAKCREHALRFIGIQGQEFRRMGVFWDRSLDAREQEEDRPSRKAIYRTLDRTYEAEIVRQLGRFFVDGGVYHGVKPVHWCSSCKTALAEAEVEYIDRDDPSVYVRFPVEGLDQRVPELAGRPVALVIWTTTPWTLPANLAVALHPDLEYVAVDTGRSDGELLIVAAGLLESVAEKLGWQETNIVSRFSGKALVGEGDSWVGTQAPVTRPYLAPSGPASQPGVLILGEHVTLDAGTGCVHTAPGHGADDFNVGKRYGLETFNPVGDDGRFLASRVGQEWLADKYVLKANEEIVQDLEQRGLLLHHEAYHHSYPHCWRCKNPVLFRSTPQWFISMEANDLRRTTLEQIRKTRWIPASGETRISQMIETRPDWCISRQRTWGVPIPAVVCSACIEDNAQAFVRDPKLFDHLAQLFETEGSDAWFGAPDDSGKHQPYASLNQRRQRLIPEDVNCEFCKSREDLTFHEHIVDVWFESGTSHAAVLTGENLPWPADMYLEGHDQHRGWFHSSLLIAVHDRGTAPYREVLTHGFTLDGDGRKMSKSLGNTIAPQDVAARRGIEILRLWVSMIDFLEDMRLSEETLDRNAEAYRKIRNTFRYMLGNLDGFDPANHSVPLDQLTELDRWALSELEDVRERICQAYTAQQYHIVYHTLHQFCSVTLSSIYFDILKDRLYTFPRHSVARHAAQTTLLRLATDLVRLMAPVLCFTAEEIWQQLEELQGREPWSASTVHAQRFPEASPALRDPQIVERWERLMRFRDEVQKALEPVRADKTIGTALEAKVTVSAPPADVEFLSSFGAELRFLFGVSQVDLAPSEQLQISVQPAEGAKCERCWNYTVDVGQDSTWPTVCQRCADHIAQASAEPA